MFIIQFKILWLILWFCQTCNVPRPPPIPRKMMTKESASKQVTSLHSTIRVQVPRGLGWGQIFPHNAAAEIFYRNRKSIHQWSCTITEKAPTRAFSWLKAATTAFTFKNLIKDTMINVCWPYGKRVGQHSILKPLVPFDNCVGNPISRLLTVGSMPV